MWYQPADEKCRFDLQVIDSAGNKTASAHKNTCMMPLLCCAQDTAACASVLMAFAFVESGRGKQIASPSSRTFNLNRLVSAWRTGWDTLQVQGASYWASVGPRIPE